VIDPEVVSRRPDAQRLRDRRRTLERAELEDAVVRVGDPKAPAELPLRVGVPVSRPVAHRAEPVAVLLRAPAEPGVRVVESERVPELVDERDRVERPVDPEPVAADVAVAELVARAERRQHHHHVAVFPDLRSRRRRGQAVDPLPVAADRLRVQHLLPREHRAGHRQLPERRLVQPAGCAPEDRDFDLGFVNGSGPQVTGTTSTLRLPVDGAACAPAASTAAAATAASALSGAT